MAFLISTKSYGGGKMRILYNIEDRMFNTPFIPKLDSLLYLDYQRKQADSCKFFVVIMNKIKPHVYDIYLTGWKKTNWNYETSFSENSNRYMSVGENDLIPIIFQDYDLDFSPPAKPYTTVEDWEKGAIIYRVNTRKSRIVRVVKK